MKPGSPSKMIVFLLLLACGLACLSYGDGLDNNEVEFTGTVTSVLTNGDGTGTVSVQIAGVGLRVIVNAKSDVVDKNGDELALASLKTNDIVEIEGKYSPDGILASKIQVTANADTEFDLRGHITAVDSSGSNVKVSLLGLNVLVTPATKITSNGAVVAASDLKVGTLVRVEGTTGSVWTATSIKIITNEKQKAHVRFKGVVTAVSPIVNNEQTIAVKADGVTTGATTVHVGPNTRVTGSLAVGASVLVVGTLNTDLSVAATKVRVLEALEIKPDERKLKVGETAVFTVKLHETAAADTVVTLSSSAPAVLSLPKTSVTVLQGSKTADFSANALTTGAAVITAEALGQKATAEITVGEVSEDENEHPAGETRIMFAPGQIKLDLNTTREVVLLIQPPQKANVTVTFEVSNGLVTVAGTLPLGKGASQLKVKIQSGSAKGNTSVIATLPQELGGGKAELMVEVTKGNQGQGNKEKTQIDFHPDQVVLDIGQTATVELQASAAFDADVVIALAVAGNSNVVEVPSAVTLPQGLTSVQVSVKGIAAGNVHVLAALPQVQGGDKARLEVEVKGK